MTSWSCVDAIRAPVARRPDGAQSEGGRRADDGRVGRPGGAGRGRRTPPSVTTRPKIPPPPPPRQARAGIVSRAVGRSAPMATTPSRPREAPRGRRRRTRAHPRRLVRPLLPARHQAGSASTRSSSAPALRPPRSPPLPLQGLSSALAFLVRRRRCGRSDWLQAELLAIFDVFDTWFRRAGLRGLRLCQRPRSRPPTSAMGMHRATAPPTALRRRTWLVSAASGPGLFARKWHILMKARSSRGAARRAQARSGACWRSCRRRRAEALLQPRETDRSRRHCGSTVETRPRLDLDYLVSRRPGVRHRVRWTRPRRSRLLREPESSSSARGATRTAIGTAASLTTAEGPSCRSPPRPRSRICQRLETRAGPRTTTSPGGAGDQPAAVAIQAQAAAARRTAASRCSDWPVPPGR